MAEAAIQVKDLSKKYGDDVQALDGISFEVEAGSVFGLLGPNGAGKSTTVKILTTLSHPSAGTASIMGYNVLEQAAEVRRNIGVVAQSSTADREATARENLRLQGQLYRMKGRELEQRIDSLLESFKLSDDGDRIVRGFSGGMERRLTVAMALVHNPRVLFLDEPTTGLDPEVRAEMWEEISALAADEGTTILLTTHYLEEADMLARNLAIVDQGRIVAEGTPDGLKKELKGDAIQVGLGETREQTEIETALGAVNGVSEVILNERTLHARAEDGARSVPSILAALDSAGITADTVTVSRPSLDDVYLKYAGRTMEQAEKKQTEEVAA
jgi:ABC-2 type transport system ATP-binding protein